MTLRAQGGPVRVVERGEPWIDYLLEQQVADVGGPAAAVTLSVAQLSALVGPGDAREQQFPTPTG